MDNTEPQSKCTPVSQLSVSLWKHESWIKKRDSSIKSPSSRAHTDGKEVRGQTEINSFIGRTNEARRDETADRTVGV
jgi:hypothetical protein